MPLSATAAGSVSAGTCSLTEACQAGPNSAMPLPTTKHSASRIFGVTRPSHASTVSDVAPVVHVGNGAGRHRDQHDRQHQRGLHQRDLVGGRRHLRHRPGRADALDQYAEVGYEAGEPDTPEHAMPQRGYDPVSRKTQAFRLVGHDRFRWRSVTGLIPFEFKVMPAKALTCPVA